MATLAVSPSRTRPNRVKTITFVGTGTAWLSGAPTFSPSVVAGVSVGAVTVVSDVVATAPVTFGANVGTLTWTDSTTSATSTQIIRTLAPIVYWVPRRRS